MNLDKYRSQAKYAAWYDDPDEPSSYNPFRKVRTGLLANQNNLRNVENGDGDLNRSITDQEDQHAEFLNRQAQMGGGIGGKQRYGTAPVSDRSQTKPVREDASESMEINRTISPEQEESSVDKASPRPLEETKESTSGDTIAAEDTTTSDKPRHRKGLKGMFHRKEKEVESDKSEADAREKPHFTFGNQIKATLFNSWINILLIAGKLRSHLVLWPRY